MKWDEIMRWNEIVRYGGCGGGLWYRWVIVYANGRWYFTRNIFLFEFIQILRGHVHGGKKMMRHHEMEGSGNFGRFLCVFSIVLPTPEGAFYFLPLLERVYQNVFYFIFLQCTTIIMLFCCVVAVVVDRLFASFGTGWLLFVFLFFVVLLLCSSFVCLVVFILVQNDFCICCLTLFVVFCCCMYVCSMRLIVVWFCSFYLLCWHIVIYCCNNNFSFQWSGNYCNVFLLALCCIPVWVAPLEAQAFMLYFWRSSCCFIMPFGFHHWYRLIVVFFCYYCFDFAVSPCVR